MRCDLYSLSLYLDGDLAPAQYREVASHIRDCPSCRRELDELRTVDRTMMEWGSRRTVWPAASDMRTRRSIEQRRYPRLRALSRASSAAVGTLAAALLLMLTATIAPMYQPTNNSAAGPAPATRAMREQSTQLEVARSRHALLAQPAAPSPPVLHRHAILGVF